MATAMVATPPDVTQVNGNGHPLTGDNTPDHNHNGGVKEPKFASGLILPPPEIKCAFLLFARDSNDS